METLNYTVSVTQNWDKTSRTGTITFYNEDEGLESVLTVTQEGFEPVVETAAQYWISGDASTTSTIPVTTNTEFNAEVTNGSDWLSTSSSHTIESPDITLTVTSANSTGAWRTATLRLYNTSANFEKTITVVQSVAGTVWSDDFEWLKPWADASGVEQTVETDNLGATATGLGSCEYNGVSALQALTAIGYELIYSGSSLRTYLQPNYLKFGRTGDQGGIVLPTNVLYPSGAYELTFDWCPMRQGSGKLDPVNLIVVVNNGGSEQTFEVPTHGWENGHRLEWIHASVDLSSATINENTTITIKQKEWGVGTANRWFLDNVKIVKK